MKRNLLFLTALLFSSPLFSADYLFIDKDHPVHLKGNYRSVGKARFRTESVKGSHERYAEGGASVFYSHYLTPQRALSYELGYKSLKFDWPANPRFSGDNYNFALASIGYVSTIERWRWVLNTGFTVDAQKFNFAKTAVYYGMGWGRYALNQNVGIHIGGAAYYGVRNGYVLPIFGIDWHFAAQWQFNLIFPIETSLHYYFNENWSLVLEYDPFGGPYKYPYRAHDGKGRFHDAIFNVYSKGLDLNLKYRYGSRFAAGIGGGYNTGGWILIKDYHNHHGKYYKFDGAPYAQGYLALSL